MSPGPSSPSATSLRAELRAELDQLEAGGALKTLREISSPQGPEIRFADGTAAICLCSNDYLGLAADPAVVAAAAEGPAGLRRRDRLGALHLRPLHSPPRARARSRRLPRHRAGDLLRLLLERQPGAARHALRQAHLDPLRRAQPRLDHRRHPARPARRQGGLRARRPGRARARARRRSRGAPLPGDHRRRLQHGGRSGAAAGDRRADRIPWRHPDRRRLTRARRPRPDRPRHGRALRAQRPRRHRHRHPRQGPRWRGGRVRRRQHRALRAARAALARPALLQRAAAIGRLRGPRRARRPPRAIRVASAGCTRTSSGSAPGSRPPACGRSRARARSSRSSSARPAMRSG